MKKEKNYIYKIIKMFKNLFNINFKIYFDYLYYQYLIYLLSPI